MPHHDNTPVPTHKWKVGDLALCINNKPNGPLGSPNNGQLAPKLLRVGAQYTVVNVYNRGAMLEVDYAPALDRIADGTPVWSTTRFIPIPPSKETLGDMMPITLYRHQQVPIPA